MTEEITPDDPAEEEVVIPKNPTVVAPDTDDFDFYAGWMGALG